MTKPQPPKYVKLVDSFLNVYWEEYDSLVSPPDPKIFTRFGVPETKNGRVDYTQIKVTSPGGKVYIVGDCLTEFCKRHNISPSNLNKVIRRQFKQTKGWKLYSEL